MDRKIIENTKNKIKGDKKGVTSITETLADKASDGHGVVD